MRKRNESRAARSLARERAARRPALVHELIPPEGVPIRFVVARLGARVAAQLTDLLLSVTATIATLILLALTVGDMGGGLTAIGALLFFAIRTPYYVASELFWNGRTLGKRMAGLRVVAADGRGLTTHAVVVRNLMKEVEVFVPGTALVLGVPDGGYAQAAVLAWIAMLVAVPRFNRRCQRIGDMIAGTMVVRQPQAILLPDLTTAAAPAGDRFVFDSGQLDHYGRYELQTLERMLRAEGELTAGARARWEASLLAVTATIRNKIGYPEAVAGAEAEAFLRAFYAAQRAYLEQRRLFGDAREDKFHGRDAPTDAVRPAGAARRLPEG